MKVLAFFKNLTYNYARILKFKDEDQAFEWWGRIPCSEDFDLLDIVPIQRTRHKYAIEFVKESEEGKPFVQQVFVYSKKQVKFVTRILEEKFPYMYNIKTIKVY